MSGVEAQCLQDWSYGMLAWGLRILISRVLIIP